MRVKNPVVYTASMRYLEGSIGRSSVRDQFPKRKIEFLHRFFNCNKYVNNKFSIYYCIIESLNYCITISYLIAVFWVLQGLRIPIPICYDGADRMYHQHARLYEISAAGMGSPTSPPGSTSDTGPLDPLRRLVVLVLCGLR